MFEIFDLPPGGTITKPGVYRNVPIQRYHSDPGLFGGEFSVSSSGLRTAFHKSLKHFWCDSPYNSQREEEDEEEKESKSLVFGRASHHLILGQSHFEKEFVFRPDTLLGKPWHGSRTDCKQWLADKEYRGLTVLTPNDRKHILGIARSLEEHPFASAALRGLIEHTICWRDQKTGIWIKVRPDSIPNSSGDVADLKTAADVAYDAIERAIGELGYNMQGGLVAEAFELVLGIQMTAFALIFAEKKRPYCIEVYELKSEDIDLGRKQNRVTLDAIARCRETGIWPGPGGTQSDARHVELKPWDRNNIEFRLTQLEMEIAA